MWSRVRIGGNTVHGDSVFRTALLVSGVRILDAERRRDGSLWVSADLYDEHGRRVGAIVANKWAAAHQRSVFIRCQADQVVVEDVLDAAVLLNVAYVDGQLVISAMRLSTRDGRRCLLDERGGLTLHTHAGIATPQYITGDIVTKPLGQIDLASTFTPATRVGHHVAPVTHVETTVVPRRRFGH